MVTKINKVKEKWYEFPLGKEPQIFRFFTLFLYHWATETLQWPWPFPDQVHMWHTSCTVLGSNMSKTLCEWLDYLSLFSKQVNSLAVSMDGTLLLSGSQDQTARVWHVPSRQCLRVVNHKGKLNHFTLRSDWRVASPYNMHSLSSRQVMRILILIS